MKKKAKFYIYLVFIIGTAVVYFWMLKVTLTNIDYSYEINIKAKDTIPQDHAQTMSNNFDNKQKIQEHEAMAYLNSLRIKIRKDSPFLNKIDMNLKDVLFRRSLPQVSAIFDIGGRKIAIVNGQSVKVSDRIGDFLVKDITFDYVLLEYKKKIFKVYVQGRN